MFYSTFLKSLNLGKKTTELFTAVNKIL